MAAPLIVLARTGIAATSPGSRRRSRSRRRRRWRFTDV